jgi:hypothetical protein
MVSADFVVKSVMVMGKNDNKQFAQRIVKTLLYSEIMALILCEIFT